MSAKPDSPGDNGDRSSLMSLQSADRIRRFMEHSAEKQNPVGRPAPLSQARRIPD